MELKRVITFSVLPMLLASWTERPVGRCERSLRRLEGWTIAKVGNIRGSFEGCNYDRLIELDDGTILRCSSYGYQYGYMPEAVVFTKADTLGGQLVISVRMMVESEVYDMQPVTRRR